MRLEREPSQGARFLIDAAVQVAIDLVMKPCLQQYLVQASGLTRKPILACQEPLAHCVAHAPLDPTLTVVTQQRRRVITDEDDDDVHS